MPVQFCAGHALCRFVTVECVVEIWGVRVEWDKSPSRELGLGRVGCHRGAVADGFILSCEDGSVCKSQMQVIIPPESCPKSS